MIACNDSFKLTELNIIGGDYKEFPIYVNDLDNGGLMDVSDLQMNFSLIEYHNRNGSPILTKNLEVSSVDSTAFLLVLTSEDTINLKGKYIYQITVKAPNNKQESFQGIMIIDKNINPNAFATT